MLSEIPGKHWVISSWQYFLFPFPFSLYQVYYFPKNYSNVFQSHCLNSWMLRLSRFHRCFDEIRIYPLPVCIFHQYSLFFFCKLYSACVLFMLLFLYTSLVFTSRDAHIALERVICWNYTNVISVLLNHIVVLLCNLSNIFFRVHSESESKTHVSMLYFLRNL